MIEKDESAGRSGSDRDRPSRTAASSVERAPETTLLTWSVSFRRRRPKAFWLGILALVFVMGLTWIAFPGEVGFVVLAALMMTGALGSLYFPTRFRFTNKKVYQKIFASEDGHRWTDFEDYQTVDGGVYLRLRPSDLRLRYLKGMTVYFGPSNRDEVMDHVRRQLVVARGEGEGDAAASEEVRSR